MSEDYRLELRVKNGHLYEQMLTAGCETQAQLARLTGVSQSQVGQMMNLKTTCYNALGAVRSHVAVVAEKLGCLPDELFPQDHLWEPLKRNRFYGEANKDQLLALSCNMGREQDPAKLMELEEDRDRDVIADMISACTELTDRERKVLTMRHSDGLTLDEAGRLGNVCRERIRNIEQKAFWKMRKDGAAEAVRSAAGHFAEDMS